ncbi:MAG: AAA family ATPase [Candidatus Omnitrophica bacterium]|nr:AAA family ATPase [Candidatus Omnitrophota bacterium]MBU4479668.1 AAA family ATPase [Candidatus Omnitrophota bacterium]MCG2703652.1 AAA family ATPase [Candidatus Omnitrophota bacterium]
MRIIAIANQKGGCGKTTTAINLSACLAQLEKSVLLIDLDPQGHATLGLNIQPQELEKTMYNVLTPVSEKRLRLDEIIIPVSDNFDLAPANILLSAIEQELSGKPEREARLAQAISLMVGRTTYDYIIIDCSPSLGLLTFNGLRASHEIIAPVDTGFFSLHGISRLLETVNLFEKELNYSISVKALITVFDRRTKFAHEVKDEIYKYFSGKVFSPVIHNNVRLKEASSYGVPVVKYDKRSRGAQDYSALARELAGFRVVTENAGRGASAPETKMRRAVFAYYAPEAQNVEIAGDFNSWAASQGSKLEGNGDGLWKKEFNLEPGRYRYKFIVDGAWVMDPNNPNVEVDNSGNTNSLLELK